MVVKYADNVLKGFATSLSIVLSAIISAVYFQDVSLNTAFIAGSAVVLGSVYLYGYTPQTPRPVTLATDSTVALGKAVV
jgi:solute carrier family 35 (UDP-sugar transporter), member A1/2/3